MARACSALAVGGRGRGGGGERGGGRGGARSGRGGERGGMGGGAAIREALKRRSGEAANIEDTAAAKVAKTEFDYSNVDFKKFGKEQEMEGEGGRKHNKNQSGGGRQKQRFKNSGSKSSTFKK